MLPVKNIENFYHSHIVNLETAVNLASRLKEEDRTVGLCHGCFDLLHPGHIKHLESAKYLCDFLFVSITADEFVKSTKGFERPIFQEELRAYMLANLRAVDCVIISKNCSGDEIIQEIKPSLYIKGPECKIKITPGLVKEINAIDKVGGKIVYTADPLLSTTEIINYIQNLS